MRDITERVRESSNVPSIDQPNQDMSKEGLQILIRSLGIQMKETAKRLEFEKAALIRDEMIELKKLLVEQEALERGAANPIASRNHPT